MSRVRCPYFPGRGYACNLVPCPFDGRQDRALTSAGVSGKVRFPKYNERHTANAIPVSPQEQEKAPEKALLKVLHIMPCRKSTRRERGYIGRVQRPVSVKTRQPLIGLGSVVPCLFYFPKQ